MSKQQTLSGGASVQSRRTWIAIVIGVLLAVKTPDLNIVGMTMILQLMLGFGFILPVNAPQNGVRGYAAGRQTGGEPAQDHVGGYDGRESFHVLTIIRL